MFSRFKATFELKLISRFVSYCLRSQLSIIDHNHHCQRPQMKNWRGELVYSRRWSKKAGRWIPVLIKEPKQYDYIPYLLAFIIQARKADTGGVKRQLPYSRKDPRNRAESIAKLPARPTTTLVAEKRSRFNIKKLQ